MNRGSYVSWVGSQGTRTVSPIRGVVSIRLSGSVLPTKLSSLWSCGYPKGIPGLGWLVRDLKSRGRERDDQVVDRTS